MYTEIIINGLLNGSLYALAALGYTLVYGVLGFVNFAHGEIMTVGAFTAYCLIAVLGLPLPLALAGAFTVAGLAGLLAERLAYRPLYGHSRIAPVISSLGVSILLRSAFMLSFGPQERSLSVQDRIQHSINLLGANVPVERLLILLASILLMVILLIWVGRTEAGRNIRAVSQSPALAQTVGINLFGTISLVFFVASGVGGMTGALVAWDINVDPNMGLWLGFKGFTASILGGIGSILGALLGGLLLGLIEHLAAGLWSATMRDAVTFIVLILLLLVRPNGLMGKLFRRV